MSQRRIEPADYDDADAQRLVAEVQEEYVGLYGSPDVSPIEDDVFSTPRGAFYLVHVDDVPVAMGGWRLRTDVRPYAGSLSAEVKRMYVAPSARRRGHARAILSHLEATAREAGADAMILETGTAQAEAIAMYVAAGYELIEKFGYYTWSPLSRCFGKRL